MTNREWLSTLTDEEMAEEIYQFIGCEMLDDLFAKQKSLLTLQSWLKAEH